MDETLLRKLVKRAHIPTPGDSSFVSCREPKRAIEAAVIHHHRLAFYYWVRWTTNDFTSSLPTDNLPPDLVTVDWHDDVGCEADCVFEELRHLVDRLEVDNVNDQASLDDAVRRRCTSENNVAAYSFLGCAPGTMATFFRLSILTPSATCTCFTSKGGSKPTR